MLNTFIIIINNLMGETKLPEKENVSVPMNERNGKPKDLFFIWFASNIGILGVVYGALIVGFQLSFVQSVLAALVAAFSFVLVGYISIAGKENGITTFMLSRAAFGTKGNWIPNFLGWLNLTGWLSVNVVTGTLILLSLANVFNLGISGFLTVVCLLVFAALVILSGFLTQEKLAKSQTLFTYVFGGLTLIILVLLLGLRSLLRITFLIEKMAICMNYWWIRAKIMLM